MENNSQSSVTVIDVARAAGVSVGTVSRVLNGHTNITRVNHDRVRKAIDQLGYEKSRAPENLVSHSKNSQVQTGNIGMVYTEMGGDWANHPLVSAYSMGVERACQEKGFHALIEFSADGKSLPRCVQEKKIDGLLIKVTRQLPPYLKDLPKTLPVICVGLNDPTAPVQQVAPDNRGAGWLATDYLWNLGHRRIGFICADLTHPMFLARFQGYEGFLRSKRSFDPSLCSLHEADQVEITPDSQPPELTEAVEKLLAVPGPPVTAFIAANDWMAYGLYLALEKAGKRVKEELSVIGFDNAVMLCTSLRPQLTSFAIPFGDVAYAAAIKLMERIQSPGVLSDHSLHLIRGEIIERASVKSFSKQEPILIH